MVYCIFYYYLTKKLNKDIIWLFYFWLLNLTFFCLHDSRFSFLNFMGSRPHYQYALLVLLKPSSL